MSTALKLDDGARLELTKHAVSGSIEKRLGERASVQLALGATLAGDLAGAAIGAGPLGTVAGSYRVVDEKDAAPFVILGASLGASWSRVAGASLTALDGRVGVTAGKTIANVASPYLAARAFGLPVFYGDRTGTDAYHYQLGAGLALRAGAVDAIVEGVPLGEKAITAGIGIAF